MLCRTPSRSCGSFDRSASVRFLLDLRREEAHRGRSVKTPAGARGERVAIEISVGLGFESFGFGEALEIFDALRLAQNILGAGLGESRFFLLAVLILDLVARLLEAHRGSFVEDVNDSRNSESSGDAHLFADPALGDRARCGVESRVVGMAGAFTAGAFTQVFLLVTVLEIRGRLH